MNQPILSERKLLPCLQAVLLLLFILCAGRDVEAQRGTELQVCNEGSVDIVIAGVTTKTGFFSSSWELWGWYKLPKGTTANRGWTSSDNCVQLLTMEGFVFLVVGLHTPDNRFGVVKYDFPENKTPSWFEKEELCVNNKALKDSGSGRFNKYIPPCPEGFKAVPTSISIGLDYDQTRVLRLKPTPDDYKKIAVYLR